MILGNKCDANDKRQVSREQGEKVSAVAVTCFNWDFSEHETGAGCCLCAPPVPRRCSQAEPWDVSQGVGAVRVPALPQSWVCGENSCRWSGQGLLGAKQRAGSFLSKRRKKHARVEDLGNVSFWLEDEADRIVFSGVRCYLVKVEKVPLHPADVTTLTRYLWKKRTKDKRAD